MAAMGIAGQTLVALNIALLLQLGGLVFAIFSDPYIRTAHRNLLLGAVAAVFTLILQNQFVQSPQAMLLGQYRLSDGLLTLLTVYGYCVRPVVLVLFMRIVSEDRRPWLLVAVNAVVNVTALFSGLAFTIVDGVFHRGAMGYTTHVIGALLLIWDVWLSYRYQKGKKGASYPIFIAGLLLVATALDTWVLTEYRISLLTVTIVSACVFYYIWLHLEFVRAHEQALMTEQRVQIMLSQIKPHFLYNALGAIEELCGSDPPLAKAASVKFAQYLRGNMDALSAEGMIPFEREFAHTRLYLELEQLRFEDALQVRYDVACTDFKLPTLTLEPLAENAVRHGVRGNADGVGTVTVSTREYPDHYEVSVTDDGPGFDPASLPDDGDSHIGLRNVRQRLTLLYGDRGTVTLTQPEEGRILARVSFPIS